MNLRTSFPSIATIQYLLSFRAVGGTMTAPKISMSSSTHVVCCLLPTSMKSSLYKEKIYWRQTILSLPRADLRLPARPPPQRTSPDGTPQLATLRTYNVRHGSTRHSVKPLSTDVNRSSYAASAGVIRISVDVPQKPFFKASRTN